MMLAANRFRQATVGRELPPGAPNCPRCNERGIPEEEIEDMRRGRFRRFEISREDIRTRGFDPQPHEDGLRVWFPGRDTIAIGNDCSLFPRLIRGTLCYVEAPNNGGEMAIAQEMPEMRPFPGRIAELDGYTYTSIGRAEVQFDTIQVMRARTMSRPSSPAAATQSRPSTSAPNPYPDGSPENENAPPDGEGQEEGEEEGRSPEPS